MADESWASPAVVVAYVGILASLLLGYLNLAQINHWWPFEFHCPSILNSAPSSIERSTAGAYADGNGRARIVWRPPRCQGSSVIVSYDVYAYDFNTHKFLP